MVSRKIIIVVIVFILIISSFSIVSAVENNASDGFENAKSFEGNNIELSPNEEMFVYIDYNFTATDTFNVNATARNNTLIDSRNLTIII